MGLLIILDHFLIILDHFLIILDHFLIIFEQVGLASMGPRGPFSSKNRHLWKNRSLNLRYIYIYGCLSFHTCRELLRYVPLCRPVSENFIQPVSKKKYSTCVGPVSACVAALCRKFSPILCRSKCSDTGLTQEQKFWRAARYIYIYIIDDSRL